MMRVLVVVPQTFEMLLVRELLLQVAVVELVVGPEVPAVLVVVLLLTQVVPGKQVLVVVDHKFQVELQELEILQR
jgi:hypothetical protein